MKYFSSIHDRKSRKYVIYYSIVLVGVMATVVIETFQFIHQPPIQGTMTFFEGFFSLFMLSRHEKVGSALLSHLSQARHLPKLSLF